MWLQSGQMLGLRPAAVGLSLLVLGLASACSEEEGVVRLRPKGEFEPAAVDFGDVPVDAIRTRSVKLRNVGAIALGVETVELPDGFALARADKERLEDILLPAGEEEVLELSFAATREGRVTGIVAIVYEGVRVELEVAANGVIARLPELSIAPDALDFGVVEVGGEGRRSATITNSGNADGVVDAASLASTMAFIGASDAFQISTALPLSIPAGGTAALEVVFRPTMAAMVQDRLLLGTGGQGNPLSVGLLAEARVPRGELFCNPSSVDFGALERGMTGSQQVACTSRGGPARLVSAAITGSDPLFILPSPPGTMDLTDGASFVMEVNFESRGEPSTHRATLTVTYNGRDGVGSVTVPLTAEVVPPPPTATAITARLEWSTNRHDVDLHLVRPGSRPFDTTGDCHYRATAPDWNTRNDNTDDPFLDRDDTDGFGPEEINLQATAPGRYEVWVHFYSNFGGGTTNASVEIFIAGQRAGQVRDTLRCNDLWHAADIQWDGSNGTLIPVGMSQRSTEGTCF